MKLPVCWKRGLPLLALLSLCPDLAAAATLTQSTPAREALQAQGVTVDINYTSEDAANLSGGAKHSFAHAGQLGLGAQLDLEKLWGWPDTTAQIALSLRDGDNLNTRAGLGQQLHSQEVYGRGSIWRLGSLWLSKRWESAGLALKVGRMGVGEDFNTLDCMAMNLTFCGSQPAMIVGDYWLNGPASQWGAVMEFSPDEARYVRLGVYQVNPRYTDEQGGGLRLAPSGTVGTLTPIELGWNGNTNGLSHHYAVGAWYSSAPRADAWQDVQGQAWVDSNLAPALRSGAYGAWLSVHRQLTHGNRSSDQAGLEVKFDAVGTDHRTGAVVGTAHAILIYRAPWATRPSDQLGLGVGATEINPRARQESGDERSSANIEYTAEAFFAYHWHPGVVLQPVVQYVVHPGGRSSTPDALVVGLKTQLSF